jgi:hypothetical protein
MYFALLNMCLSFSFVGKKKNELQRLMIMDYQVRNCCPLLKMLPGLDARGDKSVTIVIHNYNPFDEQATGLNSCDIRGNVDVCKLVTELLPARISAVDRRARLRAYRYSIIVSHTMDVSKVPRSLRSADWI